jgi:hypothetical protein
MKKWMGNLVKAAAFAAAVALGPAGASPLHAQQDESALAQLRTSMSAESYASVNALVRDARERGLPTQPLLAKALEGAAKNVAGERIVAAVRQTSGHLVAADALLRPSGITAAAEVAAVATALQRGVPQEAVARFAAEARGSSGAGVGLSAHVLADVMAQGVPVAVGVEVIGAWRAEGADPVRLGEIPAAVERLVRQGIVPGRAGAAIAAGLRNGRAPASIRPVDVPRILGGG